MTWLCSWTFTKDLKLPPGAITQIAGHTRAWRAGQFGVRQVELAHNDRDQVYWLLEGPDEQAIRAHHAALGVPCGDVHQVSAIRLHAGLPQAGASTRFTPAVPKAQSASG